MMPCCFAIIPDSSHQPSAMFADLEEAMDWGLKRYGDAAFRITYVAVARIENDDAGRHTPALLDQRS
jgi:hypothetical protein